MTERPRQSTNVNLPGTCGLWCGTCDCRMLQADKDELQRALDGSADRVVLRGAPENNPSLSDVIYKIRTAGKEAVVRTNGVAFDTPEAASKLVRDGAQAVLIPMFSHRAQVHDRVVGQAGAFVKTLQAVRCFADAGLAIEIEVALLNPKLQNLRTLLDGVLSVAPSLRFIRLFVPTGEVPEQLTPPRWDELGDRLPEFLRYCTEAGVRVQLNWDDGVPLCVLSQHEDLFHLFRFNPKKKARLIDGASHPEVCATCKVKPQCSGVVQSYVSRHDGHGLQPYKKKPRRLYEQRTTPKPLWTEDRKSAASNQLRMVLRPTVNCNQDCPFCSANETSSAVWPESAMMLKKIARAGQIGVNRLSFSGGEPMLARDLPNYIRAARRVGIPVVELVTNGVLLAAERRAKPVIEAGLTDAFFSLHAHDELISQVQTRKVGDFARTVQGIKNMLAGDVRCMVNHIVNSRNYRYLSRYVRFIHDEFGSNVAVSFAFITPQYQALESMELVPKLSDVMPYLHEALHLAVELKVPFVVGSRQGIPACFLKEFRYWSDLLDVTAEATTEDSYQKTQGPQCAECQYSLHCTGLWKAYVDRFGVDELEPLLGPKLTHDELHYGKRDERVPITFDDVPERLRDREAEAAFAVRERVHVPAVEQAEHHLVHGRSRPLRVQLAGTGRRAQIIARDILRMDNVIIGCVSSPHACDSRLEEFGHAPAYSDSIEAMDDTRPEALVVATSTRTHWDHIEAAVERNIPVMVEKPLVANSDEVDALLTLAESSAVPIVPAHQVLYATGVEATAYKPDSGAVVVNYRLNATRDAPDAPRAWSTETVYQTLYHALVLVGRSCGGGVGTVSEASVWGELAPVRIHFSVSYEHGKGHLQFDFAAAQSLLELSVETETDQRVWRRAGREVTLTCDGVETSLERRGSEIQLMLTAFQDCVVNGNTEGLPTVVESIDVMTTARAAVDALVEVEPRFKKPKSRPRHVQSRKFMN